MDFHHLFSGIAAFLPQLKRIRDWVGQQFSGYPVQGSVIEVTIQKEQACEANLMYRGKPNLVTGAKDALPRGVDLVVIAGDGNAMHLI